MIIKYNRTKGKKKYIVTSESSGWITVTDKMAVRFPDYIKCSVSVDQDMNESSSDI